MDYKIFDAQIRVEEISSSISVPFLQNNAVIYVCIEGSVKAMCNRKEKLMKKGDIMIAFPCDIHSFIADRGKIISITFPITISDLTKYYLRLTKYENFLHLPEVVQYANDLYRKTQEDADFFVIYGYLHIILGLIVPNLNTQNTPYEYDTFVRAVEYMRENYALPITQQTVAKSIGCSASHLSRLFSERIEGGFKFYLNFMRIEKVKRWLERSNDPIYTIWSESGFADQYTFNRTFKKMTGMTPTQYKKQFKLENKII